MGEHTADISDEVMLKDKTSGNTVELPQALEGGGFKVHVVNQSTAQPPREIIAGLSFSHSFTAPGQIKQTNWVNIQDTNWLDITAKVPSSAAVSAQIELTDAADPNVTPPDQDDIVRPIPAIAGITIAGSSLGGINTPSFGIPAQQSWARITVTSLTGVLDIDVVTYDHDTPPTPAQLPIAATITTDFRAALVRSVMAGTRLDGSVDNLKIAEHAIDSTNRLPAVLTNGTPGEFTVDDTTDVFTAPTHGLVAGDAVVLSTSGTLPTPLTSSTTSSTGVVNETVYWVSDVTTDTFKLRTTYNGASAVNVTSVGAGTHQFQKRGQFVGTFRDLSQIGHLLAFYISNVRPAVLRLEWSDNGTTQKTTLLNASSIAVNSTELAGFGTIHAAIQVVQTQLGKYARTRIVNGPADMNPAFSAFEPLIGRDAYTGSFAGLESSLSEFSTALLTRAVIAGTTPDGDFRNALIQGRHTDNSTTTPLPGDTGGITHIFTGKWVEWQHKYTGAVIDILSDAAGTVRAEFSQAEAPVDDTDESVDDSLDIPYDPATRLLLPRTLQLQSRWFRVKYINGQVGQTRFKLDVAFLTTANVVGTQPIANVPTGKNLATMSQAIGVALKDEEAPPGDSSNSEYFHIRGTLNERTEKRGIHVHATGFDEPAPIKPVTTLKTGQGNVTSTGATPFPPTPLTDRATVRFCNLDPEQTIFFSEDPNKLTGQGDVIFPLSPIELDLAEGEQIYFQIEDAGGTTAAANVFGASTLNNNGVVNPNDLLTDNAAWATLDNVGDSVEIQGFTAPETLPETQRVLMLVKARKAAAPTSETVTFMEADGGETDGSGVVSSSTLTTAGSGLFHLAYISRNSATGTVQNVTGLGLTWLPLQQNLTVGNRRMDVWYAYGTCISGMVSASMSISTNAHIAVICCDGVHPTTPIQNHGATTGTGTAVVGPAVAGTNLGMAVFGVTHTAASATAGVGYTERYDDTNGGGANADSLHVSTKPLTVTGGEVGTADLVTSSTWGAIGVTLLPANAEDPVIKVSHRHTASFLPTTVSATLSATTDATYEADISGDAVFTADLINSTVLKVELVSKGAANAEVNVAFLNVTEATEGNFCRISWSEVGGGLYT